jgi:hypothetical protein
MKFIFLSLMLILSSVGQAESASISAEAPPFKDVLLPNPSVNFQGSASEKPSISDMLNFKQKIVDLATNEDRTPEGKGLTQAEANSLVDDFVKLNIQPEILISYNFQSDLAKSIQANADKAQVIQTITNIAKTRIDMNTISSVLQYHDVRCFFRKYADSDATAEMLTRSKSEILSHTENPKLAAPLTEIYHPSDDVVIVGKCQGCGLLNLEGFAMAPGNYSDCKGR